MHLKTLPTVFTAQVNIASINTSVGWGRSFFVCCLDHRGLTGDSLLLQISVVLFGFPGIARPRLKNGPSLSDRGYSDRGYRAEMVLDRDDLEPFAHI